MLILLESGILLIISAVVVSTQPARGYEISVYNGFPLYFIVLLVLSYLIGFNFIVSDSLSMKSGQWVLGLGILGVTTIVFLSLPIVRGYHLFLTGDAMFHIGKIKQILSTGYLPEGLIYPALHTLVVIVTKMIDRPAHQVLYSMTFPLVITFIGFAYLFAQGLKYEIKAPLIVFASLLVVVLPGSVNTSPYSLSAPFIFLVVYITLRNGQEPRYAYKLILGVVLGSLILFHILSLIYSIVAVGLLFICVRIYSPMSLRGSTGRGIRKSSPILFGSVIAAYIWLSKEISFKLASTLIKLSPYSSVPRKGRLAPNELTSITDFSPQLPELLEGTLVGQYLSVILQNNPALIDILRVFVFKYGPLAFLSIGVSVVIIYYSACRSNKPPFFYEFITIYIFGIILRIGGLFLTAWSTVFRRVGILATIFGLAIVSIAVHDIDKKENFKKAISIILIILILLVFSIGFVSTYNSPLDSTPSAQRTGMDMTGGEWLFTHSLDSASFHEWGFSLRRYSQYRTGEITLSGSPPPDHFGYNTREYYASEFTESTYLIITQKGLVIYPKLHPNYRSKWRFFPNEFNRLQSDPTVQRVYVNGEFSTYYHD